MFHIINYYFKYWEFLDTFFLVIKKKKLMFLHVYHHMATAALCYSQIVNETPLSWVIICLNLTVHVIMYGYYAMTSIGIRCPWKKMVTSSQIIQFVIDVAICAYGSTCNVFCLTHISLSSLRAAVRALASIRWFLLWPPCRCVFRSCHLVELPFLVHSLYVPMLLA